MANNNTNTVKIIFEGDAKKLEAAVNKAEKALKGFDNKSKKTGGSGSGLGMITKNLKGIAGLAASAFATEKLVEFGREAISLGAKMEGIKRNFELIEFAGKTSMGELKEATMGAVSEFDLMQKTVQARNFKLPLENLASFFEFATVRAQQTGESVDYLVNSIVLGIGRKSPLILDNLGITLVRLKEAMGKVGRESATVEEISQGVAKIAKEEVEVMKSLGYTTQTAAQKIAGLTAQFKDFKASLGEEVVSSSWWDNLLNMPERFFSDREFQRNLRSAVEEIGAETKLDAARMLGLEDQVKAAPTVEVADIALMEALNKEMERLKNLSIKAVNDQFGQFDVNILRIMARSGDFQNSIDRLDEKEQKRRKAAFLMLIKKKDAEMAASEAEKQAAEEAAKKVRYSTKQLEAYLKLQDERIEKEGAIVQALYQADTSSNVNEFLEAIKNIERVQEDYNLTTQESLTLEEERLRLQKLYLRNLNIISDTQKDLMRNEQLNADPDKIKADANAFVNSELSPVDDTLVQMQDLATMMSQLSSAFSQIANLFGGADTGIGRFIAGFSKVVAVVAAAVGAMAAFKTLAGDLSSAAVAVGVATAVAGAIAGIANVAMGSGGGGGAGFASSYNGGETKTYTELRGRDIRIAETRDRLFSDRRG